MLQVELVTGLQQGTVGGIGRYASTLHHNLAKEIDVRMVHQEYSRLPGLSSLPLRIAGHQPGSIAHFTQIVGCAQMLWNPVHPCVATVHDLGVLVCDADRALFSWFGRRILDLNLSGLRQVDAWIGDSEYTRQTMIDELQIPANKIQVIYLGVDHDCYHPIAGARDRLKERYPGLFSAKDCAYLLYVGSELPRKNLPFLLDVLAQLNAQGIPARLIKIGSAGGEKWRQQFLAEIHKRQLADKVELLNHVPEDDLPLFYNAADIYVQPSLLEGFGWPVLEAMACGTPVVATKSGSLPEIIGAAGICAEATDVVGFADRIQKLICNDRLYTAQSAAGLHRAAEFTWDRTVASMIDVYSSLEN